MNNIIILTAGLAGSSVLTALLSRAGYWTGQSTKTKPDYNTWENAELVDLNNRLLGETGFTRDWKMNFEPEFISHVVDNADKIDWKPYQNFLKRCDSHAPWIWKDPRLWLTIHLWRPLLNLDDICFLVIRRDDMQDWISSTIRRKIQTPDYARRYNHGVRNVMLDFLKKEKATFLDILYEDLIIHPGRVVQEINQTAGTALTLEDFKAVFRGTIGKKQHGLPHRLLAYAIYLKNYPRRYR